ncbi:zinc finger protein 862-like [Osmerus eperlanus]|uniref:zinc finger protein 862-like n=1 Tax=Osmerus eperlanus TaxID=29151 RepID=UPI002E116243
MTCLKNIKDAGDAQPPGSFLAQLHSDLDNPARLGAFNIVDEEERERRGRGQVKHTREVLWSRYRTQVMAPYLDGLQDSLDRRFQNLNIMEAFHVLGPKAVNKDDSINLENIKTLSTKFLQQPDTHALQEWSSFKQHVLTGAFKDMDQLAMMTKLPSQHDEWCEIYPSLSKLAAIALMMPISSVNCERDFSTMNRVKTDLRNRLQGEHLAACMLLSINGPPLSQFPYNQALELFFQKKRKIKCTQPGCQLCH